MTLKVGCSTEQGEGRKLKVVATDSPINGIAGNVGGDPFMQQEVVLKGSLPYIFEPQPSLAKVLAEAD